MTESSTMADSQLMTQCPFCKTVFRCSEKQLAIADSKVRCGACFSIFNGKARRVDENFELLIARAKRKHLRYDNSEDLSPNTLLVNIVLAQPGSAKRDALDEAFDSFEKDIDSIVQATKDEPDSSPDGIDKRALLSDINKEIQSLEDDFSEWEEQTADQLEQQMRKDAFAFDEEGRDRRGLSQKFEAAKEKDDIFGDLDAFANKLENQADPHSERSARHDTPRNDELEEIEALEASLARDLDKFTGDLIEEIELADVKPGFSQEPPKREKKKPKPAQKKKAKEKPKPQPAAASPKKAKEQKSQRKKPKNETKLPFKQPLRVPLPVWMVGSVILLLGLYSQILLVQKERLSQHPTFRSHIVLTCSLFGCEVPALKDLDKIVLVERLVVPNSQRDDVLDVKLVIANTAKFEQPFPDIELIFTDHVGTKVASRRFKPEEYIMRTTDITTIPPDVEVNIRFSVKQPKKKVTGFQFEFH